MDGSVANGMVAAIISMIIIAILIVSGMWLGVGYFVGNSKYDKGYLQGQLDYRKGIIKIKTDTITTNRLK
jgi:uncharacterized membrane protein YdbT with pleckstrin-like domain